MCGFVGIYGSNNVASELHESLMLLQHRGQDAAGIAVYDSNKFSVKKDLGLVSEIFNQNSLAELVGNIGLGHVRYPTVGGGSVEDTQPLWIHSPYGIAMAHNGNIFNFDELKEELYAQYRCHVNTGCDVEIILNLLAGALQKQNLNKKLDFETVCKAVKEVMQKLKGGYSVVAYVAGQGLIAFRDPYGIRPAIWGTRNNGSNEDYIFASEKVVLDVLGFENAKDIDAGEVIFIDNDRKLWKKKVIEKEASPCIFEQIYFARPDSFIDDVSVYKTRLRLGEKLAKKVESFNLDIDVVIPVPDSSCASALALAQKLGIQYREGLFKNRYIGRTFIMPGQEQRQKSVRRKLNPSILEIKDKKILLVDDSIVRGTTSKEIVEMVKEAGAKKVYFASAAPPIRYPCLYGIDMPSKDEFIADGLTIEEIRDFIGADELIYQDIDSARDAALEGSERNSRFCMSCFDGFYSTGDVDQAVIEKNEKTRLVQKSKKKKEQMILI